MGVRVSPIPPCRRFSSGFFRRVNNSVMRTNYIRRFNANPWRKNIPDCAVRAIVMAIGMKYELVCRKLGMAWRRGYGLVRGSA